MGERQMGYESLAWTIRPSRSGNYVLTTLSRASRSGVVAGESWTYRIPVDAAEEFIRDFASAYGECRAKCLPDEDQ